MRVLLVNPGYADTFWSFNRSLEMLGKKNVVPPLGLLTVAAMLPQSWEIRLADLLVKDLSPEDWDNCDAVLVTGMFVQHSQILRVIREGKRRGKTVVVGGPWVFHFPMDALESGADIVVQGECEGLVPQLVEALVERRSGLIVRSTGPVDLEQSPVPRYDLLDMDQYMDMAVQFTRGCPFHCEFCDVTFMYGRKVRTKPAAHVIEELQSLYDLGWRRAVFFVDDNFIGNPLRAKALLKDVIQWQKERGFPFDFYTQASVNLARNEDVLDLMVQAGFFSVFLGIETTDEASLTQAGKLQNVALDPHEVCDKINRAGLQIMAGCMMGFDNEEPGTDQRFIDFAMKSDIPEMYFTLLQAAPGTELWNRLESEGRLLPWSGTDDMGNQSGMTNFVPTRPVREVVSEFIRAFEVLYEPRAFLERAYRHIARMESSPPKKGFFPPTVAEIRCLAIMILRQGVLYPTRWTFWRLLASSLVNFPARVRNFLIYCVRAEHYFHYRSTIRRELEARLPEKEYEMSTVQAELEADYGVSIPPGSPGFSTQSDVAQEEERDKPINRFPSAFSGNP
jgi:radical SAM superfamily enzyme YgiQ (UPF0313 family)